MRHTPRFQRRLAGAVILAVAATLPAFTAPAGAATPTCPALTAKTAATQDLLAGVRLGPALVTTPGKPDRTLTGDQATAFIQSWLPSSIYEHLQNVPTPHAPISHLYMNTSFGGTITCITAWYAANGSNTWVGMPAENLGFASVPTNTWILAPIPARTIGAFEGKVKPIPVPTGTTTTTVAGKAAAADSSSSSSSSTWLFVAIPAVILAGLGGWLLVRGRNRAARAG